MHRKDLLLMRLNHVDIVDASFSLQKDMTLTVDNGRISAIAKDILSVPADEEEYDLSGMILNVRILEPGDGDFVIGEIV